MSKSSAVVSSSAKLNGKVPSLPLSGVLTGNKGTDIPGEKTELPGSARTDVRLATVIDAL